MIRKYVLPLLAILGLLLAIHTVRTSSAAVPATQPIARPAEAPYKEYVAGAGLVEASTENIAIGTLVPGVVTNVAVEIGQTVKAGNPLFTIDDRELQAQLAIEQAAVASTHEQLAKLEQSPRPEDVPPLEAKLRSAEASEANQQRELDRLDRAASVISKDERDRAFYQLEIAKAEAAAAKAELDRTKAGTWKPDLEIARAAVASAQSRVDSIKVEIDRRTVHAPVNGTVLQVKTRRGEYASAGPLATPLMLLGDVATLHVRIDVDENDAWRIKPNAEAVASVRGNRDLKMKLTFVRIEPYIVPKRSLTGDSNERVDTRVLQVIYAFNSDEFAKANNARVYPGQQMDAYIDSGTKLDAGDRSASR